MEFYSNERESLNLWRRMLQHRIWVPLGGTTKCVLQNLRSMEIHYKLNHKREQNLALALRQLQVWCVQVYCAASSQLETNHEPHLHRSDGIRDQRSYPCQPVELRLLRQNKKDLEGLQHQRWLPCDSERRKL